VIVIWDNGADYSDHAIAFVDVGEGELADRRLDLLKAGSWFGAEVLAVAKTIEWFSGQPLSWSDFVKNAEYYLHTDNCEEHDVVANHYTCTCWVREEKVS